MRYGVEIVNGTFILTFANADDFMAVQSILAKSAQQGAATTSPERIPSAPRTRRLPETDGIKLAAALIEAMDAAPTTGLPSSDVARVCKVTSTSALGPVTKVLRTAFAMHGLDIERVRTLRRTARRGAFWMRGPDFQKARLLIAFEPPAPTNGIHSHAHDGGNGHAARATATGVEEKVS